MNDLGPSTKETHKIPTLIHHSYRRRGFIQCFTFTCWFIHVHLVGARTGFACHSILPRCYCAMFRTAKKKNIHGTSMTDLVQLLQQEIVAAGDTPSSSADPGAAFMVPDVGPGKIEGVRAKKSCLFIERPESVAETFLSVVVVDPLERYMHWLLHNQEQKLWLHKDSSERPVVKCATPCVSPIVKTLAEYTDGIFCVPMISETLQMLDGCLVVAIGNFICN